MERKFACWEVTVQFKVMDMSGGDSLDGPRWTGRYLDRTVVHVVVAPTEALATAGALSAFYEHHAATAAGAKKMCDVHAVVQV